MHPEVPPLTEKPRNLPCDEAALVAIRQLRTAARAMIDVHDQLDGGCCECLLCDEHPDVIAYMCRYWESVFESLLFQTAVVRGELALSEENPAPRLPVPGDGSN